MTSAPSTAPYVFGLEHVPLPAVVCDREGRVLWMNGRFAEALGPETSPSGAQLRDLVKLAGKRASWPPWDRMLARDAPHVDVSLGGQPHTLHAGPAGDCIGCVFAPRRDAHRPSPGAPSSGESRASLVPPSGHQLLEAFIRLTREFNVSMREEELVRLFAETFERLFPDRRLSIRLVDPETLELSTVWANGRLLEEERQTLCLTDVSRTETGLSPEDERRLFASGRLAEVDEYRPVFVRGSAGFEVPLCDGKSFYGLVNVEYEHAEPPVAQDRSVLVPLAHELCTVLRNARLVAETIYLKDYLEKLLDRANAPVIVVNREHRITVVNQALERLTGQDRGQLLGNDVTKIVAEPDRPRLLAPILAALRGEPTSNVEVRVRRSQEGETAHVAFNTAAILSAFGEVEGVIFVGQDLTEVRNLQRQVIHSEKLATLGQVAAGVAHELNNPLTSISVYATYLARTLSGRIPDADLAKLKRIEEGASRIQSFTKALVAYARPSSEEPVLVKVGDLLERALSFCEHMVNESGADVTLDVADDLPPVYGIRGQLEQVVVNLLTNACHAIPRDGGRIALRAVPIDDDRIEISVEDNGCGIPEEHREAIFEPFFTTKKEGLGTGLGLSIVKNILHNHNAEIFVESEIGKGTTFRIRLYAG